MEANGIKKKLTRNHQAWSPYLIHDYISFISPCAFIARLMGLLPYKIVASQFVLSKLFIVSSTILTIIYLSFIPLCIRHININHMHMNEVSVRIHNYFIVTLGPIIIISAYIAKRSLIQTMRSISRVSQILPAEFFSKSSKVIFAKDAIMITPPLIHLLCILMSQNLIVVFICWGTFFTVTVTNSLYTNSMYVLNGCFQQINDSLINTKETLINDEPHLLRRVYHTQKNPVLLAKFRTLKEQHLKVSTVLRAFNDTLSMQNAAIIALLFVDITFNVFTYMLEENEGGKIKTWNSFCLLFLIYHSVHVVMMVWPTEVARMQTEQIGANIHRIIAHTFDEQVITELEMFSLQVLQKDVTLVAMGIAIDATLLTKFLCSITTFLLILIQFLLPKTC
ncbi:uncharacterized protein LOC143424429 [Xylocopa sonorina]|uniref:uncharacterized protein LOC143424429 n=1 Tax=Xylocopa sonorina TaxID=1818115 RepID=UPI00403B2E62